MLTDCPICGKKLRIRNTQHKDDNGKISYYEYYAECPRCKQYKLEAIGCNYTLFIKDKEYYALYSKDFDTYKIALNISMCRLFYKIHKKIQKITKRY